MKKLTLENLSEEYSQWVIQNGNGRNKRDLRFGQYMHSKYDVDALFPGGAEPADAFYTENAAEAFTQLVNVLLETA